MKKQVTMKDIAEEIGVSIVAVSKALGGKEGVGDELRETIIAKAEELGYIAKSERKQMKMSNPNIAIVISERFISDNAFYFKVYQKMIMELSSKGFIGLLEIIRIEDEDAGELPKVVLMNTADQVIVIGEMKMPFLESLSKSGVKMILFDFENQEFDVDSVISDNVTGGYTMTRYLANNGYKKIGFVGNYFVTRNILDRLVGSLKYKFAKSLPHNNEWILLDRDSNGKYIDIKLPDDMPEAFFCNCDEVAYRMIRTLEDAGYKVPQDIAIVGYDDYAPRVPEGVALTTYKVDVATVGYSFLFCK
jgi:LacI family transcriptional regulator